MNKQDWDSQVKETDKETQDPVMRATKVWNILREFEELTDWDLVCFSSEFLNMMSIGSLPYLTNEAKAVSKLIYMQHYFDTKNIPETVVNKDKLFKGIMEVDDGKTY